MPSPTPARSVAPWPRRSPPWPSTCLGASAQCGTTPGYLHPGDGDEDNAGTSTAGPADEGPADEGPADEGPADGGAPAPYQVLVGGAAPELDRRLSTELDAHSAAATPGVEPAHELTGQVLDGDRDLLAGLSGWTWRVAAGIALTWVQQHAHGTGHGARLLLEFEDAARSRGCTHVFATSFTFQAPDFYRRAGYRDILRWDGLPTPEAADIHLRKELT